MCCPLCKGYVSPNDILPIVSAHLFFSLERLTSITIFAET